jgi:hypothetical protein
MPNNTGRDKTHRYGFAQEHRIPNVVDVSVA